ncbi:MAG: hypothetical protein AAF915_01985 [Cyanobacteria bacterium P01_D01_bin.50]
MKLFSTKEAAEKTGIPQNTIRTWLSRHSDYFELQTHVVIDEHGRKLWTEEGLKHLVKRKEGDNYSAVEDIESLVLDELLEAASTKLAIAFFDRLPSRTLQRIQRMLSSPTQEESEMITASINAAINSGTSYLNPNLEARRLAES